MGFSRAAYHEGIFGIVASEPIAPAAKDAAMDRLNTITFLIIYSVYQIRGWKYITMNEVKVIGYRV